MISADLYMSVVGTPGKSKFSWLAPLFKYIFLKIQPNMS